MTDIALGSVVGFVLALIISTIVIYVVAKLTGEREGLMTAFLAALIGTIIYIIAYFLLGNGLLAAVIAGIFWLLALKVLYKIGWLKALLTAILIWILTAVVGIYLPTLTGPL
ncbi:MAG: hypothetical protein SA339_13810 [Methanomassiliicoccus sp.]|nr:hypothetical protein [Methanomassiliicoccus sp.]